MNKKGCIFSKSFCWKFVSGIATRLKKIDFKILANFTDNLNIEGISLLCSGDSSKTKTISAKCQ